MLNLPSVAIMGAFSGYSTAHLLNDPMLTFRKANQLISELSTLNFTAGSLLNVATLPFSALALVSIAHAVLKGSPQGTTFLGSTLGYLVGGTPGSLIGGVITSVALAAIENCYSTETQVSTEVET